MSRTPQPEFTALDPQILDRIGGPESAHVQAATRVFASGDLDMRSVKLVGFDMDYTLAIYHKAPMEQLQYDLTLKRMVAHLGYPKEVLRLKYDPSFIIRGLTVDKRNGCLIKLDSQGRVTACYRGRESVPREEFEPRYRNIGSQLSSEDFASLDTLFAMPEACLYANLIEHFMRAHAAEESVAPLMLRTDHETRNRGPIDTWKLASDVRQSIDDIHRDGSLKAVIMDDLEKYIVVDDELPITLHKLRSSGKRLFVLTNSYWPYTQAVMSFMLNDRLKEYPNWRGYFDIVLVGGRKPGFFAAREPFLEVAHGEETLVAPVESSSGSFDRSRVYQGGNMETFEKRAGAFGSEILYVGDHIFGDILRSKKDSGWRTCLIVEELEAEIRCVEDAKQKVEELAHIDEERHLTADRIAEQRGVYDRLDRQIAQKAFASAESEKLAIQSLKRLRKELDIAKRTLRQMDAQVHDLHDVIDATFNPYWGRLLKTRNELSRFGAQIRRYADVYTSKVSNFLRYSPMHLFRAPRDLMAHDYVMADSRGLTNVRRPEVAAEPEDHS